MRRSSRYWSLRVHCIPRVDCDRRPSRRCLGCSPRRACASPRRSLCAMPTLISAAGTLTVRRTKFIKSRLVPLHWSTVEALARYRRRRDRATHTSAQMPFFVGSRGRPLGRPLGQRQVHRVFIELRNQLGWTNRGATDGPRLHQLRHALPSNACCSGTARVSTSIKRCSRCPPTSDTPRSPTPTGI